MDAADGQTESLGAGLLLTLALAASVTGAKLCVLLFSYMEIRILIPGLKVLLRSHIMVIITILQAEEHAEAGGAAAGLPRRERACVQGKKQP